MKLGVGVSEDLSVAVQQGLAVAAEDAGLTSLWTNEAAGRDALLLCQAWAAATTSLEVGIGVVPLWTRSPAQLAMASATLQEASGGRFLLGIGVSHPATMGAWHGAEVVKPRTASLEALRILAQLEAGDPSDVVGEVLSSRKFRLAISPTPPPTRRYLAAMGPRMLQTAGEQAHGTLLNWSSPEEVERAGAIVRDAAAAADRDRPEVAGYVRIAVAENPDTARHALAREVGAYCALPAYAAHFERQGLGDEVARVKAAHKDGGGPEELADALGDAALQRLGWYGTPAGDIGAMLARYERAGLDHLVARVVVTGDDAVADVHRVVQALGPHSVTG